MKVSICENEYLVSWKHIIVIDKIASRKTICYLYDGFGKDSKLLCSKTSTCNSKDQYSKERGRKITLTRLLEHMFPSKDNKIIRKHFWNTYFDRKRTV